MSKLLLIDVALGVLLISLAGWVIIGRRRRERDRASLGAGEPPGTATELADEATAGPATAVVPGFGDDPAEPDPGPGAPAGPEQAAEPPPSAMTGTAPDPGEPRAKLNGLAAEPDGQRAERDAPGAEPRANGANGSAHDPDGPETEPDAPATEPRANGADGSAHDPDGPETEPDAPRAAPNGQRAAGDATVNDRIGTYYDEADRPMSDYLTAMGWTGEQETRRTG